MKLQPTLLVAPQIAAVNMASTPSYGVWDVLIVATDSRGTTRRFTRACVAIDRDPRPEGSPVLLSQTTLVDHRIHLVLYRNSWWFEIGSEGLEILKARKFTKIYRNKAIVYTLIRMPEEVYLPEEEVTPGLEGSGEVPEQLRVF